MPETSLPDNALTAILDSIDKANARISEQFPGDSPARQPVHTVYGGAHLFKADAAQKLGSHPLRSLQEHAPDGATLAAPPGLGPALPDRIYLRLLHNTHQKPVEDLR